ncbi:MAG: hypothetical protein GF355_11475 [Candidatus Eisenbacteria bacterium]|nr:hypothetical protein [Candidatus Eisenbacteria bacterium]
MPKDTFEDAVNRAWDTIGEGDFEAAAAAMRRVSRGDRRHPEYRFLMAVLLLEDGDAPRALEELAACGGQVEDAALHTYYGSLALYSAARFEEAETKLRELEPTDLGPGLVEYHLAVVLEHLGRKEEAEGCYAAAHAADPDAYPLPLRLTATEFDQAMNRARAKLPRNLRDRLDEIPVIVDELPPREILTQIEKEVLAPDIFGLFVGTNLHDESVFEVPGLPAAIYIFQRNLERACRTREELVSEVATTLYHELGHYLGLEEDGLRERGID